MRHPGAWGCLFYFDKNNSIKSIIPEHISNSIMDEEDGEINSSEHDVIEGTDDETVEARQRNKFLDAEENKKVVASLLTAWKRERHEISSLYSNWPDILGQQAEHRVLDTSVPAGPSTKRSRGRSGAVASEHVGEDATHGSTMLDTCRKDRLDAVDHIRELSDAMPGTQGDHEYRLLIEAMEATNIPALPIPVIEGVPEETVRSIIMINKRCKMCANCIRDKGHRNLPCQTLEAVIAWEKQMGAVDGALVAQIAQKLGELTYGHGMRKGKGLRCGRCKTCRVKHSDKMCVTTVAVRDGILPDRLKPAAVEVATRKNRLGSISDPFSTKPCGFDMLKQDGTDHGTCEGDDVMEYRRWGITNVPYTERTRVRNLVQQTKKSEKASKNWICLTLSKDRQICGRKNREGVKVCCGCKSPRWLGPAGQLEARVAAILDRGAFPLRGKTSLSCALQRYIQEEYGNVEELQKDYIAEEAIQVALRSYWQAKDRFKADLKKRHISLRMMDFQDTIDLDVVEAGKILKGSAFGASVLQFEDSLEGYVREQGALKIPAHSMQESSTHHANDLEVFVRNVLEDIECIVYSMYGFIDITQKLASLKSCLFDWGTESDWLDHMKQSWECPSLRKQMAIIVTSSYMFTIKSMLAYFIHCIIRRNNGESSLGESCCHICAVNHAINIPSWRVSPILVQMSDRIHDITPRVIDEEHFCMSCGDSEDPLRSLYKDIRYPLYRLVEATLNEASLTEASERIPLKYRPNPPSRFADSTKVSSFPALPVHALDWYEKELAWLGDTPDDDHIAKCIPDGKIQPHFLVERIMKQSNRIMKHKKNKSKKEADQNQSICSGLGVTSAFVAYSTQDSPCTTICHEDTIEAQRIPKLLESLPKEVQYVFRAAEQSNILSSDLLEKSMLRYKEYTTLSSVHSRDI